MRRFDSMSGNAVVLLTGTALAAFSACATLGGSPGADPATEMEIRVNNNLGEFERVSVSLMDDAGNRQRLGEVDAQETRSFDATGDFDIGARYRLMAEPDRGQTILSPEIVIREGSIVAWDLRANRVQVFEAREDPGG